MNSAIDILGAETFWENVNMRKGEMESFVGEMQRRKNGGGGGGGGGGGTWAALSVEEPTPPPSPPLRQTASNFISLF